MSPHFTLEELIRSDTAVRKGLDNTPSPDVVENLRVLAAGLEQIRALLNVPMHISSGYRSPELNALIGGSRSSAHCEGWAADFTAPGFGSPLDICRAISRSPIAYDQVIHEGRWVHVSFKPPLRQHLLTAHFGRGGATYSAGLA